MNKMFLIAVAMCFMFVGEASAQRGRRNRQYVPQVTYVQPTAWISPAATEPETKKSNSPKIWEEVADALAEVNAKRATMGLKPFINDPLLAKAALACARQRAARLIDGHLPEGDFSYLPSGGNATSAGCGAMEDSWGWNTCCYDGNYTYAGAAWVRGSNGERFMHIFVR